MAGCSYTLTATTINEPTKTATIVLNVYSIGGGNSGGTASIEVISDDDNLNSGETMTMSSTVTGISDDSVTWSVTKRSGTTTLTDEEIATKINATTGVFSPIDAMTGCIFIVTATSDFDDALIGTKDIMVNKGSVSITNTDLSVEIGESLAMKATVTGLTNESINWSIAFKSGSSTLTSDAVSATIGKTSGTFTPIDGMAGCTYVVTVTSASDELLTNSVEVTVGIGSIQITTTDETMSIGGNLSMKATVSGVTNSAMKWEIAFKTGSSTLSSSAVSATIGENTGVFTPIDGMAGCTYTIKVTSLGNVDLTDTHDITINHGDIDVTSTSANLNIGSDMSFTAKVTGVQDQTVTWSIALSSGTTSLSKSQIDNTISTGGVFTPVSGMAGCTFSIIATSNTDDEAVGSKGVSVNQGSITVTSSNTVNVGSSISMGKTVSNITGDGVTWSIEYSSGADTSLSSTAVSQTIDSSTGVFTPVSGMGGNTYIIAATSTVDNTVKGTKNVSVNKGTVTVNSTNAVSSMTLSNDSYTLAMTKSTSNLGSEDVTWSIIEQGTSIGASLSGVLSTAGVLTATDAMVGGTYRITATSKTDTTVSGYKDISINAPTVSVSRSSSTVNKGDTVTFEATITGLRNPSVTWARSGQAVSSTTINSSTGVLTIAGTETSAKVITATATVKPSTTADVTTANTKTGSNTVTVNTPTLTLLAAGNATTVDQGDSLKFTVDIENLPEDTVTWSITSTGHHSRTTISTGGELTIASAETENRSITVQAVSTIDTNLKGTKSIVVTNSQLDISTATKDEVLGLIGTEDTIMANGSEFFVIGSGTFNSKSAVKLLLKKNTGTTSQFNPSTSNGNAYSGSYIQSSVSTWFSTWLNSGGLTTSDIVTTGTTTRSTGLPVISTSDQAFLLSSDEASALAEGIRTTNEWYWLRTASNATFSASHCAYFVHDTGSVEDGGDNYITVAVTMAVRPALWVYL